MTIGFADLARSAAAEREISPPSLLALRQLGWSEGTITRHEAETLFMLNRALDHPSGEWADFFVDALCEFVLGASDPPDTCDACEAHWLIGAIDSGGSPITMAELELLVRLVERAGAVPDSVRLYALQQIERAVIEGRGPTRVGGTPGPRHVTGAECRLARRILLASGGKRRAIPGEQAREALLRIAQASEDGANSPEWPLLLGDVAGACLGRALSAGENAAEVLAPGR